MKKIITLCLLFACLQSNAQKYSVYYAVKSTVALKVGFGSTNVKINGSSASGSFQPSFGLESQLHVIKLKSAHIVLMPDLMFQPNSYESNGLTAKVNYLGFSLPILYDMFFGSGTDAVFSLYFGAGPFVGYGLSGKFKQSGGSQTNIKFGDGLTDNRTQWNSGWVFKAGAKLGKITINLEMFNGSKNLIPKDRITGGASIKSTAFYATMAYDIF
jgi:hypothetical protein